MEEAGGITEWAGPLRASDEVYICHGCEVSFRPEHTGQEHQPFCQRRCVRYKCVFHHRDSDTGTTRRIETVELPNLTGVVQPKRDADLDVPHLRWLESVMEEAAQIMRERGKKYGPGNIAEWGELGVLVRLSDKMSRLKNLHQTGNGSEAEDETVEDTYIDVINYAIIALAWRRGLWPGSENPDD